MSQEYLQDIQEIRQMMQDRSRFLSLSGLSGVLAGMYALIGAFVANNIIYHSDSFAYGNSGELFSSPGVIKLLCVAALVFILALLTSLHFASLKAKRKKEKLWSKAFFKALRSFCIPLFAGGVFTIVLLFKSYFILIAPACLIFYGMALFSASHYTFRDIAGLGIAQMVVGLFALILNGYGLYFWAFGFGILHIVYGFIMYIKYDRD